MREEQKCTMKLFRSARIGVRLQQLSTVFTDKNLIVILTIVLLNVTKVLSDGDGRVMLSKPYSSDSDEMMSPKYEEYFIEHNVTEKDAKNMFNQVGQHLIGECACARVRLLPTSTFHNNKTFSQIIRLRRGARECRATTQ